MSKQISLLVAAVVVASIVLLGSLAFAQDSQPAGEDEANNPAAPTLSADDSQTAGEPETWIPEAYRSSSAANSSHDATTVYFTPQDEDTSTTVLFLYNTGGVTATVGLQTFRTDGVQYISTTLDIPPAALVRVAADTVSTIASSWQDVVLINFRTTSAYAKMTVPPGVKAEGYVVWNGGSTYDPLQVVPTLPLRFSTDPATVFLPSISEE